MMPPPMGAQEYLPFGFFTESLQWQWPIRSFGNKLYPSGYGISPCSEAFPGSQFNIKWGDFTALRTLAASAPVAVLQEGSFSKTKMTSFLPAVLAAASNFSFIASRYAA